MVTNEQIREKLIAAIRTSGMTQTEIAKRVGIIQSSLGQYLRGRAMPALDTFANLCIVLDLDANDILCVEGNRNTVVTNSFNNNSGTISFNG